MDSIAEWPTARSHNAERHEASERCETPEHVVVVVVVVVVGVGVGVGVGVHFLWSCYICIWSVILFYLKYVLLLSLVFFVTVVGGVGDVFVLVGLLVLISLVYTYCDH